MLLPAKGGADVHIVLIGGKHKHVPMYRAAVERSGFSFEHVEGSHSPSNKPINAIRRADGIVIVRANLTHSFVERVRADIDNVPVVIWVGRAGTTATLTSLRECMTKLRGGDTHAYFQSCFLLRPSEYQFAS